MAVARRLVNSRFERHQRSRRRGAGVSTPSGIRRCTTLTSSGAKNPSGLLIGKLRRLVFDTATLRERHVFNYRRIGAAWTWKTYHVRGTKNGARLTHRRFCQSVERMQRDSLVKMIGLPLLGAVILYFVAYTAIEHRRTRLGPWQVEFTNQAGIPVIAINQYSLAISNVQIRFPGNVVVTNVTARMDCATPRNVPFNTPFGSCRFMDPTFLPGTIVLEVFGHEIQLIPRVLTIDKREQPWKSGEEVELPQIASVSGAPITVPDARGAAK